MNEEPLDQNCPSSRADAHFKQPDQLQEEYRESQRQADIRYDIYRKKLILRWVLGATTMGYVSSIINYVGFTVIGIGHGLICGALAYVLLYFKRGHLTGILSFGIVNISVSFLVGAFNPLGMLAFSLSGGLIGIGMRISDHQ